MEALRQLAASDLIETRPTLPSAKIGDIKSVRFRR
jgi:hypothetical protein